jgi:hypothetical protein
MNGKGGIVWLNDSIGHLGGRDDGERGHHPVGELLADLRDQQRTHTRTGTTTERVGDLETLKAVAALGFASDDIEDLVNELSALSVVTLGPVVSCNDVLLVCPFSMVFNVFLLPAPLWPKTKLSGRKS